MRQNAERFDGLAEAYAAFRPGYPAQAFQAIAAGITAPLRRALDVGAGPGNSTRALRDALGLDWTIAAVEPGRDMRRVLTRRFEGADGIMVLDACAERLPLPPGFATLATICAAWQWLDPALTMAEMARVLARGGVLAILGNRCLPHPALSAFDAYFAARNPQGEDPQRRAARKMPTPAFLSGHDGFADAQEAVWPSQAVLDGRALIDLWLTHATAWEVVRRVGLDRVMQDLGAICADTLPEGGLTLQWETRALWVRRV